MIRRYMVGSIMFALIASISLGSFSRATDPDHRLISVYDHSDTYSFLTQETTIERALTSAGIALDQHDVVEPARDEELVAPNYQVNIYRARPIIVVDGAMRAKILSAQQTAEHIAKDAGIPLQDQDVAHFSLATTASDGAGQILTITRARQVTLNLHGKKTLLRTQATTVDDLLKEKGLALTTDDHLSHPKTTAITEGAEIRVWREGIQTLSLEEEIAPPTRLIYDSNRPLGYRAVQSEGCAGLKTVTYQVEIREGKEISRARLAAVTSRDPHEKVEVIGLKNDGRGLTARKGAQHFTDANGISHRETYYDLPMNVVMSACGQGGHYTVRPDGAKVDRDGYIIVAANYSNYPRCSIVETSLGPGKVYDTGGFAARHPHGFDLATDWTNHDGR